MTFRKSQIRLTNTFLPCQMGVANTAKGGVKNVTVNTATAHLLRDLVSLCWFEDS